MRMPSCLAASRMVVPSGTLCSLPSIFAVTSPPMNPAAAPLVGDACWPFWLTGARDELGA